MKIKFLIPLISLAVCAEAAFAADVEFRIPAGTTAQQADWNTAENPVFARVGDVLVLINDDTESHQLHTNGKPFDHGDTVNPSESARYPLETTFDSRQEKSGLRDHLNYAKFWLVVLP